MVGQTEERRPGRQQARIGPRGDTTQTASHCWDSCHRRQQQQRRHRPAGRHLSDTDRRATTNRQRCSGVTPPIVCTQLSSSPRLPSVDRAAVPTLCRRHTACNTALQRMSETQTQPPETRLQTQLPEMY